MVVKTPRRSAMRKVKYNLFSLKRKLAMQKGRPYTWKEISHATKIHTNTLQNLAGNKTARIDLDILAKLLDYFEQEGAPIEPNDLFTIAVSVSDPVITSDIATLTVADSTPPAQE